MVSSRVQGAELKCRRQEVTDVPESCPAKPSSTMPRDLFVIDG